MYRFLVGLLVFSSHFLHGQNTLPNYRIHVSDNPITLEKEKGLSDWNQMKNDPALRFKERIYLLLQFDQIPTSDQKDALREQGVQLIHYLPNYAWIASLNEQVSLTTLTMPLRGISRIESSWKMSTEMREGRIPEHAEVGNTTIRADIHFILSLSEEEISSLLDEYGIELIEQPEMSSAYRVQGKWQQIIALAEHPIVQYIDFAEPEIQLEYESAVQTDVQNSRTTYISNNPALGYFYNGNGVSAGVQEGGNVDSLQNPNFRSRLNRTYEVGTSASGHKTNCAIRMGGAGNIDPRERGVAFLSEIFSGGLSTNNYSDAINNNLRIVSHSYGWGCSSNSTTYNGSSQAYDNLIRSNPSFMICFSAGNIGSSTCYTGIAGYGNITGLPKMGKNMSIIGSMVHDDQLAGFSSRGPAKDGRILPTLCAPGIGGTSYASPNYAGTFSILVHAYQAHNFGVVPNSGLIKSILMNSADDILNHGPDFQTGYGKMNARRAFDIIRLGQHDEGSISQGATNTHSIVVPPNAKQVKVMVYWVDWEATAGITTRSLVNDLDILLTDPNAQSYQPWVLNPTFGQATLADPAIRATDTLNNVEQVTLLDPTPGTYQLSVTGTAIPQGPQTYFVNYDIIYDDMVVIHPHGEEKWVVGGEETIRWDAFGNTDPFDLFYSIDNGLSWDTIASGVNSNLRHFDWIVPDHATNTALVKVVRNTDEANSDGPFTILGQPENLELIWSCADSSLFVWDEQQGVDGYVLYRIIGNFMDSVDFSPTNSIVLSNLSISESEYVSVAGYQNGITGRRMIAIERPPSELNCVENDLASIEILSPATHLSSCMSNNLNLEVLIQNAGVNGLSSIPLAYRIDGGTPVYDTIQDTLSSGMYFEFTFSNPPVLTGNHLLEIWTEFPLESNLQNDTVSDSIFVYSGTSAALPLIQSFDSFTNCGTSWNCEGENCLLQDGWTNLPNLSGDDIDWRTHSNATGSANTGPSGDHTSGSGKYLYLESSTCFNREAILQGPCIDLTVANQPTLSFWYHAYGSSIGELHVDVIADGELHPDVISPIIGNQGDQWNNLLVDLSPFIGQQIIPVIRGNTGGGYTSDLAIDDINIFTGPVANYAASDTFLCDYLNQIVTLNNTSSYGTNYEWSISPSTFTFELGTNTTSFEPSISFTAPGLYSVQLVATNTNGSDTLTYSNYIEAWSGSPDSLILTDLQGSCELVVPTPSTTDQCDGTVIGTTADPITFDEAGSYIVTWEFANSAGNSILVDQTILIDAIDASTTLTNGITLNANNTNADSYQWIDCLNGNAIIPGATSATFNPTSNGEYALIITENGCTDTSACTLVTVIGLNEFASLNFEIYPNPTTGDVTLSYDGLESNVMIEVSNVLGQMIHSETRYNAQHILLNIPGESGMYTVRVFDSSGVHTHKIIKREKE